MRLRWWRQPGDIPGARYRTCEVCGRRVPVYPLSGGRLQGHINPVLVEWCAGGAA